MIICKQILNISINLALLGLLPDNAIHE